MYNALKTMIESGNFTLADTQERVKKLTAYGDIKPEERDKLLALAGQMADPLKETNKERMLADHEARIRALEAKVDMLMQQSGGDEDGGETEGGEVTLKEPYDPYKWYYTGDGCSENGKNYTCKDSPSTHPCTWPPSVMGNRWELDAQQPTA